MVIAIDGPAASGKSTTSRLTANRLGYLHIDTGAMYRAMTLKILTQKIDLHDTERISRVAEQTEVRLMTGIAGELEVLLDGVDVSEAIRRREVTSAVSAVSSIRRVREVMVREQRRMAEGGGIVLEGRDIGTVVFPNADLKIYMVADVRERARRRNLDLEQQGHLVPIELLESEILERDAKDTQRDVSPLRQAEDAIVLDTSKLTVDEQVEFIVQRVQSLLATT